MYSNQAELRLEGDDGNDIFVVRAFALAATCDTDTNGDCNYADISLAANPATGFFPTVNGTKMVGGGVERGAHRPGVRRPVLGAQLAKAAAGRRQSQHKRLWGAYVQEVGAGRGVL